MSHPNTDPSVPNGLPYKWDGSKNPNYTPYAINNGVGSSQSSRDSSPVPKFSNVPVSQLPPIRGQIPSSQLPPGRPSVSPIAGQPGFKSANFLTSTPQNSPVTINTSTPIMRKTEVSSAGNILTGNNLLVNIGSSSGSVLPATSNDSNVRMSAATNIRQNLNHPLTTSKHLETTKDSGLHDRLSQTTGNLLTGKLDEPTPLFMPVNNQMVYPVPPSSQQNDNNITSPTETSKPQSTVQSHFMNPAQARFGPPPGQNVPASSQNQPQNTLPPKTTASILNPSASNLSQATNQQQAVSTSNLFPQGPTGLLQNAIPNSQPIESQKQASEQQGRNSNAQEIQSMRNRIPNTQMGPSSTQQAAIQPMTPSNQHAPSSNTPNQQNLNPLVMGGTYPNVEQLGNQMIATPKMQNAAITNNQQLSSQNTQQYKPLNPLNGPPTSQMVNPKAMPLGGQNIGYNRPPMNQNPYMTTNPNVGLGNQQIRPQSTALPLSNQRLGHQPTQYENLGTSNQNQQFSMSQNLGKGIMPPAYNPIQHQQQGMPFANAGNKQYPTSLPNVGKPTVPPTSNTNVEFQQYPTPNQNLGKPTMPFAPNQIAGNVFPSTNQNQQGRPLLSNQNLGSQQIPPSQNFNQYGPPMQNRPNLPSQNLYNEQMGPLSSQNAGLNQQYGKTMANQNMINPPINMSANQLSGPPIPNQNSAYPNPNETSRPPVYNPNIETKPDNLNSSPSTPTSSLHGKRYPQTNYQQQPAGNTYTTQQRQNAPNQTYQQSYGQNYQSLHQGMSNMNLGATGFNRIYGTENIDLLQCPNILPHEKMEPPKVCLGQECLNNANCSPE